MSKKVVKEDESEAVRMKEAEDEAEAKKKPTHMVGGKLVKEDEAEDEAESCNKEAEEEEEAEAKKVKKESEDSDEEEDEDEEEESEEKPAWDGKKKKKEAKKGEGSSQSPEESAASGAGDGHTLSPGADVPSKPQNVFVPSSGVNVAREQVTPMGKSFEDSPLMKHLEGMEKAMGERIAALEKSMTDRLANTKKELEKFYEQSFYKAASENVAPESTQALSIQKQIELGNVRFRSK